MARKENAFILEQGILSMEEAAALREDFEISAGAGFYPVRHAWKTGERDLVRVRFSDGRWIDCTPEHQIAVTRPDVSRRYDGQREALDSGSPEWAQAVDLVPGEKVRTYYGQEVWGPERELRSVPVARSAGGGRLSAISLPCTLSPELAWLLGLLATDGGMTPNGVRWHVDDDGVEARVRQYCLLLFGRAPTVDCGRSVSAGAHMRRLNISSRPLVRWLALNFGMQKGDHRKVPWQVRCGPRAVAEQFLTGAFDGDGWVGREDPLRPSWGISEAGECEDFHRDLTALLANTGLHCTRRRQAPGGEWGTREKWTLRVSAEDGYDWSWFRPAETIRAAAWHPPLQPRTKLLWTAPADGHAYAEVVAVDPLDGLHPVYDIEVPETSAFTANGILVHNSQRMRDLVGKGTGDQDVVEAVTRGIRAGFRKFKLFMITNFPGEESGDVMRIVDLGRRLAAIRDELGQPHVMFQFSWTPLLIEAQTPFQWFAPTPPDHTLIKVAEEFRDLNIQLKIGSKSLVYGTPVLTPDGFTPIESLRAGDPVIDPDGYRSMVLNAWDNPAEPVYLLTFSDGSEIEAGAGHLWDVSRWHGTGRDASGKQGAEVRQHLVTTEQLRELVGKSPMAPWLPDSPGLAHVDLGDGWKCTVDPYLLGVILGDGSLGRTLKITSADQEIVDAVAKVLPSKVVLVPGKPKSQATDYCLSVEGGGSTLNPLGEQLRALGLCCQRSWEKFVPESYKLAPAGMRLAVLQGLMDTDGCRPASGRTAKFTSASRQLRDDVLWLARSLGLCASAKDGKQASFTLKSGERRLGRPVYLCTIWETPEVRVFRLPRKLLPLGRRKPRVLRSVEYVRDEATRCIEVSAPSARFVVGDGQFIPTHNAEPNKIALFQLCQRASRDVGEAITDVFGELDTACWGGVPKDTRERLEAALRRRGFRNGLADCFDERGHYDLFGWEYISTGVSPDLMWDTYRQMVEFLEGTDAETYDSQFAGPAGGNEWIARCDEKCMGTKCGACDGEDLKLRAAYIRDVDRDVDLSRVKVIDQDSVAFKVRARLEVPPDNRFVTREHWKYAIRRAAYRAQHDMDWKTGIAKKTVQLASEACKHRDWACGTDYAEFGLTRGATTSHGELKAFLGNMAAELKPWLTMAGWDIYPAAASVRRDAGLALWELEPPAGPDEVAARLRDFAAVDYVKLVIRSDSAYFGAGTEEVNAKDLVSDLWLARDGHTHKLRMLISAKIGPYALYAALMGKPSWIEAAAKPAIRLGMFTGSVSSSGQEHGDLLRPSCEGCGQVVPTGLLGEPYDPERCPRCADEAAGMVTAALVSRSHV